MTKPIPAAVGVGFRDINHIDIFCLYYNCSRKYYFHEKEGLTDDDYIRTGKS
jgi:hypothetical protein